MNNTTEGTITESGPAVASQHSEHKPSANPQSQAAKIAEVLAKGKPECVRELDSETYEKIEPVVRVSVQMMTPTTVGVAQEMLREVFKYAIWAYREFGFIDLATLWHPDNIHLYINQHCAHLPNTSRKQARSNLFRVGRVANKQHWPREPVKLSKNKIAEPYRADHETALVNAALVKGKPGRPAEVAVTALSFGAGMNYRDIMSASPDHIVDLGAGRIGIQVKGPRSRLVPIRADYTEMVMRAVEFAQTGLFVPSQGNNAVFCAAKRVARNGFGFLELPRARSTWLKAHLDAGTPLAALRVIAGPLSMTTLDFLVAADSKALTAEAAASEGLRA